MPLTCGAPDAESVSLLDPSNAAAEALRPGDEIDFYGLLPGTPDQTNPRLGVGVVAAAPEVERNATIVASCQAAGAAIQRPPYNVTLVPTVAANLAKLTAYRVRLDDAPPADLPAYALVDSPSRSGAGFVVRRNRFHDYDGSGGRFLVKSPDGTVEDNVMERFGGIHVTSEQNWLEGSLGLRNVSFRNNTLVDYGGVVAIMNGAPDVACRKAADGWA